ncbi:MAG: nucleotidyl transferase AbiEii/AbiGii toxin family protein [Candidatus Taylorbacteria bacterium]|nr:nucleotidyl transferase AbiEii/AbiGii toxin family protein [Candidatus Taylorbacteria bacterium]
MVASSHINAGVLEQLRLEALPTVAREAFKRCIITPFFSSGGWYLAGGTALALQAGHRQSVDLDFFTPEKSFDEKKIVEQLSTTGKWETDSLDRGTVYGRLLGAKMSLIAYPFFDPAESVLKIGSVSILTPPDIAAMKIAAISQRGKKRDFVDLYWISKNIQPLKESIRRAERHYRVKQNPNHILKSLVYFVDAEDDPMPTLFFNASWGNIKKFFQEETKKIARELLGLD